METTAENAVDPSTYLFEMVRLASAEAAFAIANRLEGTGLDIHAHEKLTLALLVQDAVKKCLKLKAQEAGLMEPDEPTSQSPSSGRAPFTNWLEQNGFKVDGKIVSPRDEVAA